MMRYLQQVLSTGERFDHEYPIIRPSDGERRWLHGLGTVECDAAGHPLITLVDTPGFMVGPAVEAQAMMRHAGRVFVTAAALRVPVVSVVPRVTSSTINGTLSVNAGALPDQLLEAELFGADVEMSLGGELRHHMPSVYWLGRM